MLRWHFHWTCCLLWQYVCWQLIRIYRTGVNRSTFPFNWSENTYGILDGWLIRSGLRGFHFERSLRSVSGKRWKWIVILQAKSSPWVCPQMDSWKGRVEENHVASRGTNKIRMWRWQCSVTMRNFEAARSCGLDSGDWIERPCIHVTMSLAVAVKLSDSLSFMMWDKRYKNEVDEYVHCWYRMTKTPRESGAGAVYTQTRPACNFLQYRYFSKVGPRCKILQRHIHTSCKLLLLDGGI